jgi:NAD+ kinase
MILPADETMIVEVEEKQQGGILLTLDGQISKKLKGGDRILVKKAPYSCLLIESGRKSFYQALRTKLSWIGEGELQPQIQKRGSRD